MKYKALSALLIISLICIVLPSCRHKSKEDLEVLKSKLNYAITNSNYSEAVKLFDQLIKSGVDPGMLPVTEVATLVLSNISALNEGFMNSQEWIKLLEPLEGHQTENWVEHGVRGNYFIALMDSGQREKALMLWEKSKEFVESSWTIPHVRINPFDFSIMSQEEQMLRRTRRNAHYYFTLGFATSGNQEDKRTAVDMARKYYDWVLSCSEKEVKNIQLNVPANQAQIRQIMSDKAYALLVYCLVECGLATDTKANPFLKDQPQTNIWFQLVKNTGLEGSAPITSYNDFYNYIALGDFDEDGYVDVLIPNQGLWRNLGGSGKFKRVDKELVVDIDGQCGGFADVNNDGLVDIIIAGPNKFDVLLQTKSRIFKPVLDVSDATAENPGGMGLFDGDCDGRIDVYLAGDESFSGSAEGTADVVLRNKGDGTFEDVTEAWGFSREDIMLCGLGVSPVDYDNDGYTDLYIANHRFNRNLLWRNVKKDNRAFFFQCAASPQFGNKRGEVPKGTEQSVEGWGHTQGSAWGDINGDGFLDFVCANFAHPEGVFNGISDITRVYLNTGNSFTDNTLNSGLVFRETIMDPMLTDFNNDGHLDLSIADCNRIYINQLYEGVGDGSFKEVTFRTGAFACNAGGQASGDFDNDGDLDWFVFDGNKGMLLYENKLIDNGIIPPTANWIQLKLHGGKSVNTMAYGARVTIKAGNKQYVREVAGMRGLSNCDDQVVHVGLGNYTGQVDVEVRWIGDKVQKVSGLDINRRHEINETDGIESQRP